MLIRRAENFKVIRSLEMFCFLSADEKHKQKNHKRKTRAPRPLDHNNSPIIDFYVAKALLSINQYRSQITVSVTK